MSLETAAWSLSKVARALRAGRLSAEEYLTDLISHGKSHSGLGGYITPTYDRALAAARAADRVVPTGPLHGIPLVVKDNIDVAGVRTTAGTPCLSRHTPTSDSAVWRRLAAAGALLLGKTSMHELAYGITGVCPGGLTALNPVDPGRLAGGSSSGTATAVAAGFAPAGLGTDTGGSARIPAAVCGIVGFRPTTGRYPHEGVMRISFSRDTVGLIARDVEDILLLDAILTGDTQETSTLSSLPRPLRLAVPEQAWSSLDPEVARITFNALAVLERAGCILVSTGPEIHAGPSKELLDIAMAVPLAETPEAVTSYLAESNSTVTFEEIVKEIASPDVRNILTSILEAPFLPKAYREALAAQARLRADAAKARQSQSIDAVATPTTILPAAPVDVGEHVSLGGVQVPTFLAYIRNTAPAAVLGIPSVTIPAGTTADGLPVGLQLDGCPHSDTHLLRLALYCSHLLESSTLAERTVNAITL